MLLWLPTLTPHRLLSHAGSRGREVAAGTPQLSPFVPQPGDVPHRPRLSDTAFLIFCHLPRRSPSLLRPELVGLDLVLSAPHPHSRTPRQPLTAPTSPPSPSRANRAVPTVQQQFLALNGSPILTPQHPALSPNSELMVPGPAASSRRPHWSPVPTSGSRRQHCLFSLTLFSLSLPLCCADVSPFSLERSRQEAEKNRVLTNELRVILTELNN